MWSCHVGPRDRAWVDRFDFKKGPLSRSANPRSSIHPTASYVVFRAERRRRSRMEKNKRRRRIERTITMSGAVRCELRVERLPGCQPNKAICHGCRPNASHTLTHNLASKRAEPKSSSSFLAGQSLFSCPSLSDSSIFTTFSLGAFSHSNEHENSL